MSEITGKNGVREMTKYDLIVVGAGPAGLMAAKTAAENGLTVALIERKDIISDIFTKYFNLKIKVDFTLEEVEGKKVITNPTLDDIKRESPTIAEFIEDTDSIIN